MKFKSTTTAPFLVLCVFALTLLVSLLDADKLASGDSIYLAFLVIELMVFMVPCVFYCKLKGKGYTETLGLRPFGMGRISLLSFLLLILLSGVLLIKVGMLYAGVLPTESGSTAPIDAEGNLFYTVFTAAILPAVVEEFLFRGVILSEYAHLGGICSVTVSALFFAMLHFSLAEFPVFFFGGLVMGAAAYLTRSLLAAILLHTVYNLFTLFGESFVWKLIFEEQSHIFFLYLLAVVFLLFLVLSIGESERIFYSYAVSARGEVPFVKRSVKSMTQAISQVFLSVGFLLCVIVYAIVVLNARN
ncbi:MAG: CPBP family intramembrane metalloprotease [Ruminococcaceae bacterium]|nr:CPBP family intramembrane metalloprotease [Oscillospiraceae bacterium]